MCSDFPDSKAISPEGDNKSNLNLLQSMYPDINVWLDPAKTIFSSHMEAECLSNQCLMHDFPEDFIRAENHSMIIKKRISVALEQESNRYI